MSDSNDKKDKEPEPKRGLFGEIWRLISDFPFLSALLVFVVLHFTFSLFKKEKEPSNITALYQAIENEKLQSLSVKPMANEMLLLTAVEKTPEEESGEESEEETKELTYAVHSSELEQISLLAREHGVEYLSVPASELKSPGSGGFFSYLPFLLLPILLLYLLISSKSSSSPIGSILGWSAVRAERPDVTYNDVAGMDGPKQELRETIEFLKNAEPFRKKGARIPRGYMIVGPPGTGKTLLAKATASEAEVPFYSVAGSDFVQMFVGLGASRVRKIFQQAKSHPDGAIIFIDEIDAIGKSRSRQGMSGNDEREQTLNALLVEMDGFSGRDNVIVMAATNHPEVLDEALLRPGRFDRQVNVQRPVEATRRKILDVHVRNVPLEDEVDLDLIAKCTMGFTGADIANLVNEAALISARKDKDAPVTAIDFEDAFNRVVDGLPGTLTLSDPIMRENTAAHEAGHTAVAYLLRHDALNEPHSTTIRPGVGFLGRMRTLPRTELAHVTRRKLLVEMAILYAGRAGEEIAGQEDENLSAGAANDLMRMTCIAEHMVFEYGFGVKVGARVLRESTSPSFYDSSAEPLQIGAELQAKADDDMKTIIDEAIKLCKETLENGKDFHAAIMARLDQHEEVRGSELESMLEKCPVKEPEKLTLESPTAQAKLPPPNASTDDTVTMTAVEA